MAKWSIEQAYTLKEPIFMDNLYKDIFENLFPAKELLTKSQDEDGVRIVNYQDGMGEYCVLINKYTPSTYNISITIQWKNSRGFHPYDFEFSAQKPGHEIASEINSALKMLQDRRQS